MKRITILFLTIILIAGLAEARVPRTMNVQGVLMDDSGNVVPDGDYNVFFQLWDQETEGSDLWGESNVVTQSDGYFSVVLGHTEDFPPDLFTSTLWLSMQVEGDSPMEPRIEMTSVASALSAGHVDRGAAVLSLNGLKNNVNLQGGANVTITQQDSTLVIAAETGAGGDDGDWTISGEDLWRTIGRIHIGEVKKKSEPGQEEGDKTLPDHSKLEVRAENEGLSVYMGETATAPDGRGAVFGYRYSPANMNSGTGFSPASSNAGVMGYNDSYESYTFGVSAFSNPSMYNNGALLAADIQGNNWTSLVYRDGAASLWGLYSTGNIHSGGLTETNTLRVSSGAADGYIMTSDGAGNAHWSPPAATSDDGDWTISGTGLYRTSAGPVGVGGSDIHNLGDSILNTTLQVSAAFSPTLALDSRGMYPNFNLTRWALTGRADGLRINRSTNMASEGTTAMNLTENGVKFMGPNGDTRVELQTEADMDAGGAIHLYSAYAPTPTLYLDGRAGTGGGLIRVCDGDGVEKVTVAANYNNTGTGRIITPVLEITGGSDLSEQFDLGNLSELTRPGMVVSIDPENPGRLTLSDRSYDRRVAGVISGAGGVNTGMVMGQRGTVADGELPVALVGRVYVWADASQGPIEPGDLLTTSARPGHAMKVTDHELATGAILGKAMTGLGEGQGLILTLVTLQ